MTEKSKHALKANLAFKRPNCIWEPKSLRLPVKIRLCESYSAETWFITEVNPFHHNCLRKISNTTSKDKVRNETVMETTEQDILETTGQDDILETTRQDIL